MHPCSETLPQLPFAPCYLFQFVQLFCCTEKDENNIPSPGPSIRWLDWPSGKKSHKGAPETLILNYLSAQSSARALLDKAHTANRLFKYCIYSTSSQQPRLEAQRLRAQPWPSAWSCFAKSAFSHLISQEMSRCPLPPAKRGGGILSFLFF